MTAEATEKKTPAKPAAKKTPPKQTTATRRARGMAGLASALSGRTDALARRSTEDELAGDRPNHAPTSVFFEAADVEAAEPRTAAEPVATARAAAVPRRARVKVDEPEARSSGTADTRRAVKTDDHMSPGATELRTPDAADDEVGSVPAAAAGPATEPLAAAQETVIESTFAPPQPTRPFSGAEGRLEASGERVVKWTLELAPQIVMALNVWERDETRRLGERVYRERLVDEALDRLPDDIDAVIATVTDLPQVFRHGPSEQFGTRVRASVRDKLLNLRPELRVAGVKGIRIRDIYTAGVYRYLVALGVVVSDQPV